MGRPGLLSPAFIPFLGLKLSEKVTDGDANDRHAHDGVGVVL